MLEGREVRLQPALAGGKLRHTTIKPMWRSRER
jgi:hypothetical protein